jgi:hypothetical protein
LYNTRHRQDTIQYLHPPPTTNKARALATAAAELSQRKTNMDRVGGDGREREREENEESSV